jgi:hypothetical protein
MEQILKMVSGHIRLPASAVHHDLGLEPGHAASAYYQCDRPRDALVVNAALDGCGNPLESFRRQADGFRFGGRQLLREQRGGHDPYKNKGRKPCLAVHRLWTSRSVLSAASDCLQ